MTPEEIANRNGLAVIVNTAQADSGMPGYIRPGRVVGRVRQLAWCEVVGQREMIPLARVALVHDGEGLWFDPDQLEPCGVSDEARDAEVVPR